ncbi:MAG: bifunctional homocysteine S-methyltransferase/methylenetetrahydrofolate reductase, partial [Lachnospiraceae bacterium]|nr:bifunctional homocysteine S-methyltransferase/methylenetetrahydrofolate reductase [Lachnospiraceae bacterium]
AVDNAKKAVEETGANVYILGSIGTIRQEITMSEESLLSEYDMIIDTLYDEGVDGIFLETFADLRIANEIAKRAKDRHEGILIFASFSVNPVGYTKFGYSIRQIIEGSDEFAGVGLNCSVGAAHMSKLLKRFKFPKNVYFSAHPNAGYQLELRGRMRYSEVPHYFAKQMEDVVKAGCNIIGGCCGTTPEYTKVLHSMLNNMMEEISLPVNKEIIKSEVSKDDVKVYPNPFIDKLNSGEKVYVVELDSPLDNNADKFKNGAMLLKDQNVDLVTVSDSPMGRARADSPMLAMIMRNMTGMEVMPHIACRDRNLIALRSALLGLNIAGINNMLVITGDPVSRDDRGTITGVFDVNSIRLMEYIKNMNKEVFKNNPMHLGGALNYQGVNVDAIVGRMNKKIEQGCEYFLTQPIYSDEDIERIRLLKSRVDCKIICGIMPLVSYRNALYMHNEMPGVNVPDYVVDSFRADMSREEAEAVSRRISVEIADKLYDVADGYYFMTPFWRVQLIGSIIDEIRSKHS